MSSILPVLSTILTKVAEKLTERENYQTNDGREPELVWRRFTKNVQ